MLVKYDTSYLPKTQTCTVYFNFLFIYAPRVQLQLSRWEKDWSLVSNSVRVSFNWIVELAAKCLI